MLRVTKLADYGIVVMTQLATCSRPSYNARDLAQDANLPQPFVSKILKLLAKYGLLESHRGIKGGYALARKSEEISVAEIIRALEGPIAVTECTDAVHGECGLQPGCPVSANWHVINRAIYQALEKITLAEMARPIRRPLVNIAGPADTERFQVL
jgi:FeS assembly SUF system regulator